MNNFSRQKSIGDRSTPQCKQILANHWKINANQILTADEWQDKQLACDLVIPIGVIDNKDEIHVAQRTRIAANFLDNPEYRIQFTIRSYHRNGKTELAKILDGKADYILYGWENEDRTVTPWILGDLNIFREVWPKIKDSVLNKSNGPYDNKFIAVPFHLLPLEFFTAHQGHEDPINENPNQWERLRYL